MVNNKLIFGDCREFKELEDNTVQLIVTSPPYWNLKDYGAKEQIGYYETFEQYIDSLNKVWSECYRVLNNGCRLCINIGDTFTGNKDYGRHKIMPIHAHIIQGCENIGFDYMGTIIWNKISNHNNVNNSAGIIGSYPYPRNGLLTYEYEYILLFKKQGKYDVIIDDEIKEKSKLSREEWKEYFNYNWYFSGTRQTGGHTAMYPEEIPKRLIKMFSFVGETVLDPFMGSGTTMKMANMLNRNCIGFEINRDYEKLIKLKTNNILFPSKLEIIYRK